MAKKREIRNSTAEFLTFIATGKEKGIQVLYKDETVWATQKAMASLFDCSTDNIGLHLKNIYDCGELIKDSTIEKISVVQTEGDVLQSRCHHLCRLSSQFHTRNSVPTMVYIRDTSVFVTRICHRQKAYGKWFIHQ